MTPGPIAVVFPGQGSQKKGMGAELFDRYDGLCEVADQVLGYSVKELCLENPGRLLRQTEYTQPALFVVGTLLWLRRQEQRAAPDFLAGHSLGEYTALYASGCFDFETGVRLVQKRGALMAQVTDGGMAAVLGLSAEGVQKVIETEEAAVDIANFNDPTQLVLSGPRDELERLLQPMEEAGARRFMLLNVSGAFHSRYMTAVAKEFEPFLRSFSYRSPRIPVIANTTGRPYEDGAVVSNLVDQMCTSVRWSATMDFLRDQGVEEVEESGPGKVLTKLWAGTASTVSTGSRSSGRAGGSKVPTLGDAEFRQQYGLRHAYVAGGSAAGFRSLDFVAALTAAGCLTFLDSVAEGRDVDSEIQELRRRIGAHAVFGLTLKDDPLLPRRQLGREEHRVDAALRNRVRCLEVAGYHRITPALVRYRFQGAHRGPDGQPTAVNHLLALVSRTSTAESFLAKAPKKIVAALVEQGKLSAEEAEVASHLPMSGDICVLAGTSEGPDLATLLPATRKLRDQAMIVEGYPRRIRVGAGGAIGTPEAVASAFFLGADFIHTSSVHLCSPEAALSPAAKDLLGLLEAGDTVSAPSPTLFSLGGRGSVVKKGSFFAPRAQRLYELFRFYDSLDAIEPAQREKIETTYFKRSFESIWESLERELPPEELPVDEKTRMALVFRWYLEESLVWAREGVSRQKVNFQIPCDESLAAFHLYAADAGLADPSRRSAAEIAEILMREGAAFLSRRASSFSL